MNENHNVDNDRFVYTYSARQNQEVRAIREKYLPKPESKLEQVLRLDRRVEQISSTVAMTNGTAACLLFGMALCVVTLWEKQWMVPGVLVGIFGIAGMVGTFPLYKRTIRKQREKVAPQILKLTEEMI